MANGKPTCFVMMPISDQDGYDIGHFTRVYQHLIKPAVESAGFMPQRADDEVKANYIVIDILKKILNSDMVLCDLSSKNPNVMYELGIRQAFNKKAVLIKDNKTLRVFDIQGLRTLDYDENLRIDEVQKNIATISSALKSTFEDKSDDINSLIQLLSITPAILPSNLEISKESTLILDVLDDLSYRLSKIENNVAHIKPKIVFDFRGFEVGYGEKMYDGSEYVGELVDVHEDAVFLKKDNLVKRLLKSDPAYHRIDNLPF